MMVAKIEQEMRKPQWSGKSPWDPLVQLSSPPGEQHNSAGFNEARAAGAFTPGDGSGDWS